MNKAVNSTVLGLALAMTSNVMAAGNVTSGQSKSAMCAACHNTDGNSLSDAFPKLAGQSEQYIAKQLADFKSGARQNALMAPMVAGLSEQDMADLGAFYASKKTTEGAVAEELLLDGEKLYRAGNKQTGVPACMACHGPTGAGMPAAAWPKLSGQYSVYIEAQLHAFAKGDRSNDLNSMMRDIASKMTDDEIKAVSAYVSGLK